MLHIATDSCRLQHDGLNGQYQLRVVVYELWRPRLQLVRSLIMSQFDRPRLFMAQKKYARGGL